MTDQSRGAFEAHFKLSARQAKRDNAGEYIDEKVRDKWEGWQGAKAGMAELEKDAQRYRALRDRRHSAMPMVSGPYRPDTCYTPEGLDAAIDAILKQSVFKPFSNVPPRARFKCPTFNLPGLLNLQPRRGIRSKSEEGG